mgnify:CR=1 FL=1
MEVLSYILMVVMMAIIFIFILNVLSSFIKSLSSVNYYSQLMSMISEACISPQTSTSLQFQSPEAVIYQVYDDSQCNSTFLNPAQVEGFFNPQTPYNSTVMVGKYLLCYGQAESGLNYAAYTSQTFTTQPSYSFVPENSVVDTHDQPGAYYFESFSPSSSSPLMTTSSLPIEQFSLSGSVTGSAQLQLSFYNGGSSPCYVYPPGGGVYSTSSGRFTLTGFINMSKYCGYISSAQLRVTVGQTTDNWFNMTFSNLVFIPSGWQEANLGHLGECAFLGNSIFGAFGYPTIKKGTLTCEPIICGNNNYFLTDELGNVLDSIFFEKYDFFEIESGSAGALQIINPNTENIEKSP